jgi:hypothetical protein
VEEHRHRGLFIVRSKYDSIAVRSWAAKDEINAAFESLALGSSEEEFPSQPEHVEIEQSSGTTERFLVVSPFRSYFLAGVLGGLDKAPCSTGSSLIFVGDDTPTSLYTLFVAASVVGPDGKLYTRFDTFAKHRCARLRRTEAARL